MYWNFKGILIPFIFFKFAKRYNKLTYNNIAKLPAYRGLYFHSLRKDESLLPLNL